MLARKESRSLWEAAVNAHTPQTDRDTDTDTQTRIECLPVYATRGTEARRTPLRASVRMPRGRRRWRAIAINTASQQSGARMTCPCVGQAPPSTGSQLSYGKLLSS